MKRPLAYITAPWGADEIENTEDAARYCRKVYDAGFTPICPLLFVPLFINDAIPQEHKDGIDMARDFLRREKRHRCRGATADHGHYTGRHPHRQGAGPRGKQGKGTIITCRIIRKCTTRCSTT